MNEAQNLNLSLLSQKEIDTLVSFLLEKKNSLDSSVLSQSSIDKLIEIIRYDNNRRRQGGITHVPELEGSLADLVTVRQSMEQLCEIYVGIDDADDFLKITVKNTVDQQEMEITPATVNNNDEEQWGRCISPSTFAKLARALRVKYTADTYDIVCKRFAECIYGNQEHKIPLLYLPTNDLMIENLM